MVDLRELILESDDRPLTKFECPEWDCTFYLRRLSGDERDLIETQIKLDPLLPVRGLVAALSIHDDKGNKVFQPSDIPLIGSKSCVVLDRIFEVVWADSRVLQPAPTLLELYGPARPPQTAAQQARMAMVWQNEREKQQRREQPDGESR